MRKLLIGFALAGMIASPASAHHAMAMFDRDQPVTFSGVVKSFEYISPHAWLQLSVVGRDGAITEWAFEVDSPAMLARAGIGRDAVVAGEKVTVTAHPLKDGRPGGSLVTLIKADGTVLDPRKALAR